MKQTFEQVNAHVEKNYRALPRSVGKSVSIDKLKQIYTVVRPILLMLAGFPFIPAKWKQAVQTFVSALDVITGQIA